MSENKKTFTIAIGDGSYTKERPYTMFRFAYTALLDNHKVNIFLVEDGIFVGLKNQDPSTYDNVGHWLENIIEEGANVLSCGVCMKARGVKEEQLINGIKKTTMHGFLEQCKEADNIIFS
ncbi:MAG: DsrE/DsrF/TusD sulfur relay family protein [Promethearchaeia archaeon]